MVLKISLFEARREVLESPDLKENVIPQGGESLATMKTLLLS